MNKKKKDFSKMPNTVNVDEVGKTLIFPAFVILDIILTTLSKGAIPHGTPRGKFQKTTLKEFLIEMRNGIILIILFALFIKFFTK